MALSDAYALMGVRDIHELHKAYGREDQRLFISREWDYENPLLVINQVREILAALDLVALTEEEREWCQEILWFWHHHAISCAMWKRDRVKARFHACEAIRYQGVEHPNKVTRLLLLLIDDKLAEAEAWVQQIDEDRETAQYLVDLYKEGKMF
ncbi:MAG: hypothetical protein WCI89_03415 [bacterium]